MVAEATVAAVRQAGGTVLRDIDETRFGAMATLGDDQGGFFIAIGPPLG